MNEHGHRCNVGCPHYDDFPPDYLRVRPGMGICRASRPAARYARYDTNEVLPAWPWVQGAQDWCAEHPDVRATSRRLEHDALALLEAQEATRG